LTAVVGLASGAGLMAFAAVAYRLSRMGRLHRRSVENPRSNSDNSAFLSEQDGLLELLPEAEYERVLAELAATPPTADDDPSPHERVSQEGDPQLGNALSDAAMGMVILDREWKIQSANRGMADITGYTADELMGMPVVSFSDEGQREEMIRGLRMVSEGVVTSYKSECRLIRKDRSPVWLRCCSSRLDARDDAHLLVLSEDITADVAARERLAWLAAHDTLTGLPNRARFEELVKDAIQRADLEGAEVALICLDLDGFKLMNDSIGRPAGDAILQQVADRLRKSLDESDLLARISGDKFGVIVPGADSTEGLASRTERLLTAFAAPFRLGDSELPLSASAGISRYPLDGPDVDGLMQSANAAMHDAKRSGLNRHCFCTPRLKNDVSERRLLGNRLGQAIADGEMYVDFQPQYELAGNRLVGFEALCRWRSAALGEVEPARFIPAAEESGLIVPIGQFVLREACSRAVGWQTSHAAVRVAVNVSAVQFGRTDFVESVLAIVRETGLNPRLLELELTEGSLVRDLEESAKKMAELRAFGIRIAIDDFGTGYSSLSYLQNMPVDTLKVDRTFTSRLGTSSTAVTMVRAIIAMGQALDLHIVTEGVETEAQTEILRQLGTDEVQGYLYGCPETANAATERVRRELTSEANPRSRDGGLAILSSAIEESSRRTPTPETVQ
jgi:diguanylate cyclase (GGDEF)-like protein/PAS domain S-box-containing protein